MQTLSAVFSELLDRGFDFTNPNTNLFKFVTEMESALNKSKGCLDASEAKKKRISSKDMEKVCETLEIVPADKMFSPEKIAAAKAGEEVEVEVEVMIHPEIHESGSDSDGSSVSSVASGASEKEATIFVSPESAGEVPAVGGKLKPTRNYLRKSVTISNMKRRNLGSKKMRWQCDLCEYGTNLKKEFLSHGKVCHDGLHVTGEVTTPKAPQKTRVCVGNLAGNLRPRFVINKTDRVQEYKSKTGTLQAVSGSIKKAPVARPQTAGGRAPVARGPVGQPQVQAPPAPTVPDAGVLPVLPTLAPRADTPRPDPQTPASKRKLESRYRREADDSLIKETENKKDKVEDESDGLSDLSDTSLNLIGCSTMKPAALSQNLLQDMSQTLTQSHSQSQTQEPPTSPTLEQEEAEMRIMDMLKKKIAELEKSVEILESRNEEVLDENLRLHEFKVQAQEAIRDREMIIDALEKNREVPAELKSIVRSQSERFKVETASTQTGITGALMDEKEEKTVKEVKNLVTKLERSERACEKYWEKVRELREQLAKSEEVRQVEDKAKFELIDRVQHDKEVVKALTGTVQTLEMVNLQKENQIKSLQARVPCKKAQCKGEKECGNTHEYRDAPRFDSRRNTICAWFVRGNCKRGDRCNFAHQAPEHPIDAEIQRVSELQHAAAAGGAAGESSGPASGPAPTMPPPSNLVESMEMGPELEEISQVPGAEAGLEDIATEDENFVPPMSKEERMKRLEEQNPVGETGARPKSRGRARVSNPSERERSGDFYVSRGRGRARSRSRAQSPDTRPRSRRSSASSGRSRHSRRSDRSGSPDRRRNSRTRSSPPGRSSRGSSKSSNGSRARRRRSLAKSPAMMDEFINRRVEERCREKGLNNLLDNLYTLADDMVGLRRRDRSKRRSSREDQRRGSRGSRDTSRRRRSHSRGGRTSRGSEPRDQSRRRRSAHSARRSGNENGLRNAPRSPTPRPASRGTEEESLRQRAERRQQERTSNRVHASEINQEAAGHLFGRISRAVRRRN